MPEKRNHYKTLGLPPNASQSEITKAYRDLVKKYHPDNNKNSSAKLIFQDLNFAYNILKNKTKKKNYDIKMKLVNDSKYSYTDKNKYGPSPSSSVQNEPPKKTILNEKKITLREILSDSSNWGLFLYTIPLSIFFASVLWVFSLLFSILFFGSNSFLLDESLKIIFAVSIISYIFYILKEPSRRENEIKIQEKLRLFEINQEKIRLEKVKIFEQKKIQKEQENINIRNWFTEQKNEFSKNKLYKPQIFPKGPIRLFVENISWQQFERLVGKLLEVEGYHRISYTPSGADKGVDIIARKKNGQKTYVQVKHYGRENKIGVGVIRQIVGVSSREYGVKSMVVTSSFYTKPAFQEARSYGNTLILWDGNDVVEKINNLTDTQFYKLINNETIDALHKAMDLEEKIIEKETN